VSAFSPQRLYLDMIFRKRSSVLYFIEKLYSEGPSTCLNPSFSGRSEEKAEVDPNKIYSRFHSTVLPPSLPRFSDESTLHGVIKKFLNNRMACGDSVPAMAPIFREEGSGAVLKTVKFLCNSRKGPIS
jgi:hypothetical protein